MRAAALSSIADPAATATADPAPVDVTVVLPVTDGFRRVCWWLRRLYRTEVVRAGTSLELLVVAGTDADRRIAAVTALSLPGTRVVGSADRAAGAVTVVADPALEPPDWPWLHHLVDRLADPSVGRVGPLLVEADQTVVSAGALPAPFLRGETPADAARAAHLPVPDLGPGVVAFRTADGPRDPAYVVPDARVVVPPSRAGRAAAEEDGGGSTSEAERWRAAGFEGPGRPLRVVEGRPALRWAIDIAAPLAPRGRRWGDDPFARSLAAALERRGQWVTVDHPETRARGSRDHDDVVLVLRGLDPVAPTPADAGVAARLLWIISHPAEVTAAECAPYDLVLAAGPAWARQRTQDWGREVRTLLQCTDATRFHPGLAEPDSGPEVLFVGNSRGELRPVVRAALDAGLPLTLHGDGWADLVDPALVAGVHVPNDALGPALRLRRRGARRPLGRHAHARLRVQPDLRRARHGRPAPVRRRGRPQRPLRRPVRPAGADLAGPGRPPATGRARLARGLPRRRRAIPGRRAGGRRALVRRAGRPAPRRGPHGCRPTDLDSSP